MFVALNAYYLQEEATRALRRGAATAPHVDEVFAKARRLGVAVVRTNAFNDAADRIGDSALQVAPLAYDELSLRGLDLVLARAAASGVRLVLPLGNYWDAYGGARRYVAWAGLSRAREGDPRFFTEPAVVDHFCAHVGTLLARVSAIDGLPYADHPAILAFELLNEARGTGLDAGGGQLRAWVDRVAAHVKALAPRKLVGTGEEGLDVGGPGYDAAFWRDSAPGALFSGGSSFRANTASPWIDFASAHLYPEPWGFRPERAVLAGTRWIEEHAAIARQCGKPLFLGEFGLRNDGRFPLAERREAYRRWLDCASLAGCLGAAPWLLAYDERPASWDPYTFHLRDGAAAATPENMYGDLFAQGATPAA